MSFDAGGFYLKLLEKEVWFVPSIASFVQDSKEGDALSGITSSWQTAYPCRLCWTPWELMNDPAATTVHEHRNQKEVQTYLEPIIQILQVRQFVIDIVSHRSLFCRNELTERCNKQGPMRRRSRYTHVLTRYGIYLMGTHHQEYLEQPLLSFFINNGLGIEKYAFNFVWDTMACSAAQRGLAAETLKQRMDNRLAQFNTRHADPEMPRNRFRNGAYQLSFLTSSEYRALMYQV
jgi:hypothetical protein